MKRLAILVLFTWVTGWLIFYVVEPRDTHVTRPTPTAVLQRSALLDRADQQQFISGMRAFSACYDDVEQLAAGIVSGDDTAWSTDMCDVVVLWPTSFAALSTHPLYGVVRLVDSMWSRMQSDGRSLGDNGAYLSASDRKAIIRETDHLAAQHLALLGELSYLNSLDIASE